MGSSQLDIFGEIFDPVKFSDLYGGSEMTDPKN